MQIRQAQIGPTLDDAQLAPLAQIEPQLALVFGPGERLSDPHLIARLHQLLGPTVRVAGCSTANEITDGGVVDGCVVVTAIHFDTPSFRVAAMAYDGTDDSRDAGCRLARQLAHESLRAVLVLGQGVDINGSALIEGMAEVVGAAVTLSGGLASDGGQFTSTVTLCDGVVSGRQVVGIGFYGDAVQLSYGTYGGWQPFGASRLVTRAHGNILYQLDGEPALDIYKRYLGDYARDLPASALLFPFAMLGADHGETGLIRTIIGIDEAAGSLTVAGDIVEGGYLRLMTASTDSLVDGAESAANAARPAADRHLSSGSDSAPCLAVLVSCVGRKIVMGGRVEEEVEAVKAALGANTVLAGFYSHGEYSPYAGYAQSPLHNQTMAVTCIRG